MDQGKSIRSRQWWADKKLYPWAIASLVLTLIQYTYRLDLIGVGNEYHVWVTWIPLGLGLLTLTYARWEYVMQRSSETDGAGWKLLLWALMLVQGLLFSYTSFGLAARTTADILNRMEARGATVIYEQYPIHEAYMQRRKRRNHRLAFMRMGRREVVYPGHVKELAGQRWDPPFDIILRTTPGILGTTILLDYSWVRAERSEQTPPVPTQ